MTIWKFCFAQHKNIYSNCSCPLIFLALTSVSQNFFPLLFSVSLTKSWFIISKLLGKVCVQAKEPIRPELISVSVAWSDWEYFYSPLDGMLVHRRVTPSIKFAGTHLYTWVERGTVRVKCLAQEHNTMTLAGARTRAVQPGNERTNYEATAAPTVIYY